MDINAPLHSTQRPPLLCSVSFKADCGHIFIRRDSHTTSGSSVVGSSISREDCARTCKTEGDEATKGKQKGTLGGELRTRSSSSSDSSLSSPSEKDIRI
jgi:hypothetical protein